MDLAGVPGMLVKINQKLEDGGPYHIRPFFDEGSSHKITHELKVPGLAGIQIRWEILGEAIQLFLSIYPERPSEVPKGMRLQIDNEENRWIIVCNGSRQYLAKLPPGTYKLALVE